MYNRTAMNESSRHCEEAEGRRSNLGRQVYAARDCFGAVAMDRYARERRHRGGEAPPDPGAEILHGGGAEIVDLVEEAMVERRARLLERAREQAEVHQHAARLVGLAADRHLGAVRVAVDAPARLGLDRARERMRGVEAELLGELEHLGNSDELVRLQ